MTERPLVSCVMPTANRRRFVPMAIAAWLGQTYPNRELVILDDGESVADLVPRDPRIRHIYLDGRQTIGAKRNLLCEIARASIICHWDDDDWSAPYRIADQVARLEESGKPVTGYHSMFFYNLESRRALLYEGPCKSYALGTSLCYRRDFWRTARFSEKNVGEDNDFVYPHLGEIASVEADSRLIALIHPGNTADKKAITDSVPLHRLPKEFFDALESWLC